jgi:sulfide:quinone oxidoreductase
VRQRIVVVGSSFAGYTAALELRRKLGDAHPITVIAKSDVFLFMPSLIWVPFGLRERAQISFPLAPVFKKKGVAFRHAAVTAIRPDQRRVDFEGGSEPYDYLVVATGPKNHYGAIPGLGPETGHTQSIFGWEDAQRARLAYRAFLEKPGPVVIGAAQGASCFGAAYEFLLNFAHQRNKAGLAKRAPLTLLTSEPFAGHFGMGGFGNARPLLARFFEKLGIEVVANAAIEKVAPGEIQLAGGRALPFAYAMIAPPFQAVDAVRACGDLTVKPAGWVEVDDQYRHRVHREVFAAGVTVYFPPPQPTPVPTGVPKTGYMSEEMGRIVAHNIVADLRGEPPVSLPPAAIDAKCVLDAGNTGVIMSADRMLEPRKHAWLVPGPEAHWAKLAFEKYFLATRRRGRA